MALAMAGRSEGSVTSADDTDFSDFDSDGVGSDLLSTTDEDGPVLDQAKRRDRVRRYHALGLASGHIARRVRCHRHTVRADLVALGLTAWSDIDDAALEVQVRSIIANTHLAIGCGLDGRDGVCTGQ